MEDPTIAPLLQETHRVVPCVQLMLPISMLENMELKENVYFRAGYIMQIDIRDIKSSTIEKKFRIW